MQPNWSTSRPVAALVFIVQHSNCSSSKSYHAAQADETSQKSRVIDRSWGGSKDLRPNDVANTWVPSLVFGSIL
jgi:hypothetical protein